MMIANRIFDKALRFFTILCLMFLTCKVYSQSVTWEMPLRECSSIERVANNLFKIKDGANVGIIDSHGKTIVPIRFGEITPFYKHIALILSGNKVEGSLTDTGECHLFHANYYTLTGLNFYSEGFLTVENEHQQKGFVDLSGNPIGFDKRYKNIMPFVEGYSVVRLFDGRCQLIDKELHSRPMRSETVTNIVMGTSFYKGEAYVWDDERRCFLITKRSNEIKERKKEYDGKTLPQRDYLGRVAAETGKKREIEYDTPYIGEQSIAAIYDATGLYGYAGVLPCQFTSATSFYDNLSIVQKDNRWGILRCHPSDGKFQIIPQKTTYTYQRGTKIDCALQIISTPSVWEKSPLIVHVKGEHGVQECKTNDNMDTYYFSVIPSNNRHTWLASIWADDLELWEDSISCTFQLEQIRSPLRVFIYVEGKAHANNQCPVIVRIQNPNLETIETDVVITGSKFLQKISLKGKRINPNSQITIETCFTVGANDLEDQYVQVTVDGKTTTKSGIVIKAFGFD